LQPIDENTVATASSNASAAGSSGVNLLRLQAFLVRAY
jgi:hypothetical protein